MKRILTPMLVLLALGAVAAGAAPASDQESGNVVVAQDVLGQLDAIALDGAFDQLVEYGDPDSGIGGNRGDTSGKAAPSLGLGDGSKLTPARLHVMIAALMQQWLAPLR